MLRFLDPIRLVRMVKKKLDGVEERNMSKNATSRRAPLATG
jgi:hypothetical protein